MKLIKSLIVIMITTYHTYASINPNFEYINNQNLNIDYPTLTEQTNNIKPHQYKNISVVGQDFYTTPEPQPSEYAINHKEDNRRNTKVNIFAVGKGDFGMDFAII